jgi:hypothetical protein
MTSENLLKSLKNVTDISTELTALNEEIVHLDKQMNKLKDKKYDMLNEIIIVRNKLNDSQIFVRTKQPTYAKNCKDKNEKMEWIINENEENIVKLSINEILSFFNVDQCCKEYEYYLYAGYSKPFVGNRKPYQWAGYISRYCFEMIIANFTGHKLFMMNLLHK